MVGLEPTAIALQERRSTTELHRLVVFLPGLFDGMSVYLDADNYTALHLHCQAFFCPGNNRLIALFYSKSAAASLLSRVNNVENTLSAI